MYIHAKSCLDGMYSSLWLMSLEIAVEFLHRGEVVLLIMSFLLALIAGRMVRDVHLGILR